MKAKFYLALAAALLMTGCSQEEETLKASQGATNTLTATIEGASRSAVTDGGVFSWTAGDAISVGNGSGFTSFTYQETNEFKAEESISPSGYAIYPHNVGHDWKDGAVPTICLPATYEYGSTNAPMLATITPGSNTLKFKHLGGLMRFMVKNVPDGATAFSVTTSQGINGTFTPAEGEVYSISVSDDTNTEEANKTVTINEFPSGGSDLMTFYIPVPTGEITITEVTLIVGDSEVEYTAQDATNTVERGALLLMPTLEYSNTGLEKSENSVIALDSGTPVEVAVSTGDKLEVVVEEGKEASLNLSLPEKSTDGGDNSGDTADATLTISDGSDGETSEAKSRATLNVTTKNASSLIIDTPTYTVNLTPPADTEIVEYEDVTSKTAQQTLVVGKGVTIKKLTVTGGNVRIEEGGTVEEIVNETGGILYIFDVEGTFSGVSDDNIVVLNGEGALRISTDDELRNALLQDTKEIKLQLTCDLSIDITAWSTKSFGGSSTESILIDGAGNKLTFTQTNSDWNNVICKNSDATLVLKNMDIATTANGGNGAWNNHSLMFACKVELNDVACDNAICLGADAELNGVTIKDPGDYYGLYIRAQGINVNIDGLTIITPETVGRGIKILDEYINDANLSPVTLTVTNSTFKTAKKAAVIVATVYGAEINWGTGNDISEVKADVINAVWIDNGKRFNSESYLPGAEWSADTYKNMVVVNGSSVIVEP